MKTEYLSKNVVINLQHESLTIEGFDEITLCVDYTIEHIVGGISESGYRHEQLTEIEVLSIDNPMIQYLYDQDHKYVRNAIESALDK